MADFPWHPSGGSIAPLRLDSPTPAPIANPGFPQTGLAAYSPTPPRVSRTASVTHSGLGPPLYAAAVLQPPSAPVPRPGTASPGYEPFTRPEARIARTMSLAGLTPHDPVATTHPLILADVPPPYPLADLLLLAGSPTAHGPLRCTPCPPTFASSAAVAYPTGDDAQGYWTASPLRTRSPAGPLMPVSPGRWGASGSRPRYHVPRYSPPSPRPPARRVSPSPWRGEYHERPPRYERPPRLEGGRKEPRPRREAAADRPAAPRPAVVPHWKGTLHVRVIRANDLHRPEGSDGTTLVTLRVAGPRTQSEPVRTEAVTHPTQPVWDEGVSFACPLEEREGELLSVDNLDLQVVDVPPIGHEAIIGGATLPLAQLVKGRETPVTVDLSGRGSLLLLLEAVDFGHGQRISTLGSLAVKVLRGVQVHAPEAGSSNPDAFVLLTLLGQEHQTRTQWNTREPEWQEDFVVTVPVAERRGCLVSDSQLEVQVFDRNSGRAGMDVFLGGATVGLDKLRYNKVTPAPIPLHGGGSVHLELTALNFGWLAEAV